MKKKILIVIPNLSGGGAEKLLVELLEIINFRKYNITLCIFEDKLDYNIDNVKDLIKVIIIKKKNKIDVLRIIFKLTTIVKENQFDTIHAWMWYASFLSIISKIIVTKIYGIRPKLIISTHNDYVNKFSQMGMKGILYGFVVKNFFNYADVITSISKIARDGLVNSYNLDRSKIKVIYNGVNLPKIKNMANVEICNNEYLDNSQIIISVGTLSEHKKDFVTLLYAFKFVMQKLPEARLYIIGKGPFRSQLELLAKELEIDSHTSFLGFQQNPYKFIAKSNLFVLSSVYEGLPMVVLEAMALKVPLVLTDFSVAKEIFQKDEAVIVPIKDYNKLSMKIIEVLNDPILSQQISAKAYELVEKVFDIKKMAVEYESLY